MSLLRAVYESARINIPSALLPQRDAVAAWDALDPAVPSKLAKLAHRIESLVRSDALRLANHRRVIGEFNRGLRAGYFDDGGDPAPTLGDSPYQWGHEIGLRAGRGASTDPATIRQFITATHLLAYEFGQLEQARNNAYDFIVRNAGPQRADELGALAFALPVLIHYRRAIVEEILAHDDFSTTAADGAGSAAPTHAEYLTRGIVALFDPSADGWTRVAANMSLAALPFVDGTRLEDEHFQAPTQAIGTVLQAPIAAHGAVRRQVDRVLLARRWSSPRTLELSIDDDDGRATLWDVYQLVPAARIRGGEARFGDLVTGSLVHELSRYFDTAIAPERGGFRLLIRHLRAFSRGFDPRVEGVVDPRALASAARGRASSEALRRFDGGGPCIARISANLDELGVILSELHHALDKPVDFVLEQLEASDETSLAAELLALFRSNPALPRQLFGDNADFEFFSTTHVNTFAAHDLLRSALFHVTRAVHPERSTDEDATSLIARARADLARIRELETANDRGGARSPAARRGTAGTAPDPERRGAAAGPDPAAIARRLDEDFEILVRLTRKLVHRLHHARALARPRIRTHEDDALPPPARDASGAG